MLASCKEIASVFIGIKFVNTIVCVPALLEQRLEKDKDKDKDRAEDKQQLVVHPPRLRVRTRKSPHVRRRKRASGNQRTPACMVRMGAFWTRHPKSSRVIEVVTVLSSV